MTRETHVTSTTTDWRLRTRWAAIGAAVAVTLGAGTIATVDAVQSSGERLTYVASDPCRLMNTRPGDNQVGPRTTPLPEGTPVTVDARGAQGNCTAAQLPNDAVALQLNVTPVNATASTDITIWPTGPIPQASSVNPRPGPPVPNAVVATLHTDGTFQMQNKFGTIDMVIDVLGYFVDHNHDDRYYTETEIDTALATKANTTDLDSKSLSAVVAGDGTLVRGSGAVEAVRAGTGEYRVIFDRSVSDCAYVVSPGQTGNVGSTFDIIASVAESGTARTDDVFVLAQDRMDGTNSDASFHLIVIC